MNFIINCMKGVAIGAGAILPGISSGVLCVIFGIYEKLLDSVLNLFKNFRANIKFLLPIGIGIFIGVILFGNILNYFFYTYPLQIKSIFIGLILGSIPSLIQEVKNKEKISIKHIVFLLLSLVLGIASVILEKYLPISTNQNFSFIYLAFCGLLMSIGVVVPGISSTIILMLLGIYSVYLTSVSSLYFPVLIPMSIGLILGGIIFMKLTQYLLKYFYASTFSCIIGFALGSIFVLLPSINSFLDILISALSIILGFYVFNIFKK